MLKLRQISNFIQGYDVFHFAPVANFRAEVTKWIANKTLIHYLIFEHIRLSQ